MLQIVKVVGQNNEPKLLEAYLHRQAYLTDTPWFESNASWGIFKRLSVVMIYPYTDNILRRKSICIACFTRPPTLNKNPRGYIMEC